MRIQANTRNRMQTMPTLSGDFVYSKGECEVANFLSDQGIRFLYEPTVCIKQRWTHPDFYLLDHNMFIEFFGWEHDKKYDESRRAKQKNFGDLRLKLISLYPFQVGSLGAVIRAVFEKETHVKFPQIKYFDWKIKRKHA